MKEKEVEHLIQDTKWCPIDQTFRILGKKFTIHILRNMLLLKQKRFNEFMDDIEGINTKILSIRLKEMEENGLITRKSFNETPPRVEYVVTTKGKSVEPILEQMAAYSIFHYPQVVFKDKKSRTFEEFMGRKTKRLK
ncbi:MAG: HxlR family transcriptional regulator [Thaumarchaeota archaeon]|nr:MAG: HxlR family transcriptional regulator [Nitrososphaerota archaeon]